MGSHSLAPARSSLLPLAAEAVAAVSDLAGGAGTRTSRSDHSDVLPVTVTTAVSAARMYVEESGNQNGPPLSAAGHKNAIAASATSNAPSRHRIGEGLFKCNPPRRNA